MLNASWRRISRSISSAVRSALMYCLMSSAMMCEFFRPFRRFCVISAPGNTSRPYIDRARCASRRMSSRYVGHQTVEANAGKDECDSAEEHREIRDDPLLSAWGFLEKSSEHARKVALDRLVQLLGCA